MEQSINTLGGGAALRGTATPGSPNIRVLVFENGVEVDQSDYSGQEIESLTEQVEAVWSKYDVTVDVDDDGCLTVSSNVVPESLLNRQIPITPRKFGARAWPEDMQVMFTLVA